YLSSHAVPRRFLVLSNSARNFFWLQSFAKALRINWYSSPREILTVVSEVDDIRQDLHQVSISMLLSCHFDGGTSSKVKYCFMSDFGNSVGVSWFGFSWCSSYSSASNWTVDYAFSGSAMNKCSNDSTLSNFS
ncbi:hypothetical protein Tco_1486397, partial [Tanacetum coccineum]